MLTDERALARARERLAGDLEPAVLAALPTSGAHPAHPARPASRTASPGPREPARRPRIGVVLGAGGVVGNAYLAGAVAAVHALTGFEPRGATALVGTSAGSVHAALYGAGMPALFPLWRNRGGRLPGGALAHVGHEGVLDDDEGEATTLREIFTPSRGLPRIGPAAPGLVVRALLRPWDQRPEVALAALLPEGLLTTAAIGKALQQIVPSGWCEHPRTWIVAVNLRTGRRTAFGAPDAPRAHLDRAVRASCAIPAFYRPVRIGRDRYVDGGMHSPSNADLLADAELDLVVVLNPMSSLEGHASAGLVDRYLAPLRGIAGRRLGRELRGLRERGTPTFVLQPGAADLEVSGANLMDPRTRRAVAETATETTLRALARPEAAQTVALLHRSAREVGEVGEARDVRDVRDMRMAEGAAGVAGVRDRERRATPDRRHTGG